MSSHDDDDEGGGAHGGSWKIALADLMTVLMVFFLVMWMSAIMDPGDRQALADVFKEVKSNNGSQESSPMPEQKGDVLLNPLDLKPLTKSEIETMVKELDASVEETPEFSLLPCAPIKPLKVVVPVYKRQLRPSWKSWQKSLRIDVID